MQRKATQVRTKHSKLIRSRAAVTLHGGGTQYVPLSSAERVEAGIATQAEIEAYLLDTANRAVAEQQRAASRQARLEAAAARRAQAEHDAKEARIEQARSLASAIKQPKRPQSARNWIDRYVQFYDDLMPDIWIDDEGLTHDPLNRIDAAYIYRPQWRYARVDAAYASTEVENLFTLKLWIIDHSEYAYSLSDTIVLMPKHFDPFN